MRMVALRYFLLALCIGWVLPALSSGSPARASADSLRGKVRVVPNPWSADPKSQKLLPPNPQGLWLSSVNSYSDVNSGYSRVIFYNLPVPPATATIKIYTIDGDLIQTIEHPRKQGGATRWDLTTGSGQYAVSGIYIFTVESDIGTDVGKIIIIR